MELLLATNNPHKRREFERLFAGHTLLTPTDLGLSFYHEETETTFYGNALGKAMALRRLLPADRRITVIADDSGICVAALSGRPGVFSARYGSESLDDSGRNRHLLSEMAEMSDRKAYYVCCMVAVEEDDRLGMAQETWHGEIATEASSATGGFGYDPLFWLPNLHRVVAELGDSEKDALSHRGKAARRLQAYLASAPPAGTPG